MTSFTDKEKKILKQLNTPKKIQDFLDTFEMNHELDGKDVIKSPVRVIREKNAHCIEAAILAAYIFSLHKKKPLLMYLKSSKGDLDHVVALFKEEGYWGAISKTNHVALRYRDPVYKTLRELALSYFHEYINSDGQKTMIGYSEPLSLNEFKDEWWTSDVDLWGIEEALSALPVHSVASKKILRSIRTAHPIEIKAGSIVEWKAPKKRR